MKTLTVVLTTALLAAVGCGGSSQAGSSTGAPAELQIVIVPGLIANAHTQHYRLSCAPAAGTLPHPATACAALARNPHLLDPLRNCNKMMPDTGSRSITGSFAGRKVDMHFACALGATRWGRLARALGLASVSFK